jgi:hydrogenase maturation protease
MAGGRVMRILVAGIGNIFTGDDAFGCRVAGDLATHDLPEEVRVTDFGTSSYDLAYALMDDYDAVILVDAVPLGEPPGTVSLIEPDADRLGQLEEGEPDAHSMNPAAALRLVHALGGDVPHLYVVDCEPALLDAEEIGLSDPVSAAVRGAVAMIENLIHELLEKHPRKFASHL